MYILSWNVAGLSTTLKRIDEDYASESKNQRLNENAKEIKTKSSMPKSHALSYFLFRHGSPDIFCVQEHKIPHKLLSSRSEPFGCAHSVEGYESFWSCCVDPVKRGFNGVVTYAKTGTVRGANDRPLNCQDLDDQGRCVMTDHGTFVLFNVYVPCGGGDSLSYKLKFLNALREAMERERSTENGKEKHVILVGDLNISHMGMDVHWTRRMVRVENILEEVQTYQNRLQVNGQKKAISPVDDKCKQDIVLSTLPKWKMDLKRHWQTIKNALQTIEAVPVKTMNSSTGVSFDKFRARISLGCKNGSKDDKNINRKKVYLGGYETTPEEALGCFDFLNPAYYYDENLKKDILVRKANVLPIDTLVELMNKVVNVNWSKEEISLISNTEGLTQRETSPSVQWLNDILAKNRMIDAFRYLYPTANDRFTCWNQYTNRRFENEGSRIDYTLIDNSLLPFLNQNKTLRITPATNKSCDDHSQPNLDPFSADAAFMAATAGGLFEGASFAGHGIPIASKKALDTQFGTPHTGIVYTPPSYSDHVAVSIILEEGLFPNGHNLELDRNAHTTRSQPHKSQRSIASFFGGSGCKSGKMSDTSLKSQSNNIDTKGKKNIKRFFNQNYSGNNNEKPCKRKILEAKSMKNCNPKQSKPYAQTSSNKKSLFDHFHHK